MSIEHKKEKLSKIIELAKTGHIALADFDTLSALCLELSSAFRWEGLSMLERARVANMLRVAQRLRRDRGNRGDFS